eukprot:gene2279-2962_t
MDSGILIESFAEFASSKNIDRPTMISVLEEVFRTMIRKKYGTDDNFDVIINPESGDLEMWRTREIVDDNSEDIWDYNKIPLAEARKIQTDFEVGEEVAEEVKLVEFGRRLVQTARQTLIQKIKDMEKEIMYEKYKDQSKFPKTVSVKENPLNRTSPVFLERLFEVEIPEIYDGIIAVRRVVREPGE